MNILPKKRWHVRTKENIARVRKDEALAAEEEKKKRLRIQIAEREARTEALRKKARLEYGNQSEFDKPEKPSPDKHEKPPPEKHVNLFYELEQNQVVSDKTNEEYDKEKKFEKEKYEKQIGYLTYLGQDTNEITGQVSWYNKPRGEIVDSSEEVSKKQKTFEDPLEDIRKYLGCEGIKKVKEIVRSEAKDSVKCNLKQKKRKEKKSKHKRRKKKKHKRKSSSESESEEEKTVKKEKSIDLERLRAERIRREREERKRAEEVFARLNGVSVKKEEPEPETSHRYNSQFNPHLAKQNYVNR